MKRWLALLSGLLIAISFHLPAAAEAQPSLMLVLGDSIASGYGLEHPETQCYAALAASQQGYTLVNRAANGYMSQDLRSLLTFNDSLKEQLTQAQIIIISIGGNDFLRQADRMLEQAAHGNTHVLQEILRELEENLEDILYRIRMYNPQAPILLQTLYNPFYGPLREPVGGMISQLNQVYRDYLLENPGAYELLEVAEAFDGHPEYIAADHIHPSEAGHTAIAGLLLARLDGENWPVAAPGPTQSQTTSTSSSTASIAPENSTTLRATSSRTLSPSPAVSDAIPGAWAAAGMAGAGILAIILTVLVFRRRRK